MAEMNKTEQSIYQRLMQYYRATVDSNQFDFHVDLREQAWDFYDGIQWTTKEAKALQERGQAPIVINKIAPKIDALCALEIQRRTNISYAPRNFSNEAYKKADILTNLAMYIQEMNATDRDKANLFKDSAIGGLGWIQITSQDEVIKTKHIPAEEMLWDKDDATPDMSEQMYAGRVAWVDIGAAKAKFPAKADDLDMQLQAASDAEDEPMPTIVSGVDEELRQEHEFFDTKLDKVKIIEMQYKRFEKAYRFQDGLGNYRETFDKKFAENNKAEKSTIEEFTKPQVWVGFFTDNILLEHYPLSVQIGELEYQPLVWKRRRRDLVPVGAVYSAIDAQKEYNKRRSKMIHNLNYSRVIANPNTIPNLNKFRQEVARPDGILLAKDPGQVRVENNTQIADSQFRVMLQSDVELQQSIGISDELLGQQTNAVSGVAIAQRQNASASRQSFAFDKIKELNRKLGYMLLAYMQQISSSTAVRMLGQEGGEEMNEVIISQTYNTKDQGDGVYDVSTDAYDVVVTESAEYDAPPEEVAQTILQLFNSPQVMQMAFQAPELLKLLGVKNADTIIKQLSSASQPQPEQPADAGAQTTQSQPSSI